MDVDHQKDVEYRNVKQYIIRIKGLSLIHKGRGYFLSKVEVTKGKEVSPDRRKERSKNNGKI